MKVMGTVWKLTCLVLLVCCVCAPHVRAQTVYYGDAGDVRREVNDLKSQIQQLTTLVMQMRKTILENATGTCPPVKEEAAGAAQETAKPQETAKSQESAKQEKPVDDGQLTKIICKGVGQFFREAEAAMSMSDPDAARSALIKSLQNLTSHLHGYRGTHRVDKLMAIYEGLAWDTFTAVQLRQSIQGNATFLETLRKHKKRYMETCPQK